MLKEQFVNNSLTKLVDKCNLFTYTFFLLIQLIKIMYDFEELIRILFNKNVCVVKGHHKFIDVNEWNHRAN